MADVHSKMVRSYNMSQIRAKNTKPEILIRKRLHRLGYRYKLNDKSLVGKPDIVLPKYKTVIQVHGCFWHGHTGCKYFKIPNTRTEWWKEKIAKTKERDSLVQDSLTKSGWRVIEIWECETKSDKIDNTIAIIVDILAHEES